MSYKQIERSREIRLWLGQIILPAIGIGAVIMTNPESRDFVTGKVDTAVKGIKRMFRR